MGQNQFTPADIKKPAVPWSVTTPPDMMSPAAKAAIQKILTDGGADPTSGLNTQLSPEELAAVLPYFSEKGTDPGLPSTSDNGTWNFGPVNATGESPLTSSPSSSGSGLFGGLNAQDILGGAGLALGATGMFMNASTQKDQFNQQLAQQQQQFGANLKQTQATTGLNATQLNPYAQQEDLYKMAIKKALGTYGPAQVQLGSTTPLNPAKDAIAGASQQFLSDPALANAAGNFEAARSHADPTGTPLDLSKTGLGAAGSASQPAPSSSGDPNYDPQSTITPEQAAGIARTNANTEASNGPGFMTTLGKILTTAAPIVAAPFTGGASLALIGAGSGIANSALNGGGLGADLLGGALGAIPGVGFAKNVPKATSLLSGLTNAGKSVGTNPALLLKVLSQAK